MIGGKWTFTLWGLQYHIGVEIHSALWMCISSFLEGLGWF